jgi:hypothetical protein
MKDIYDHHIHLGYGNFRKTNRNHKYLGSPLDHPFNNLLEYVDTGVTTLRDGGDKEMLAFRLRKEAEELGITLYTAGRALVKKGCYGIHLGEPVSTLDDIKRELDFLINSGVDCIKLVQSGLVDVTGNPQEEYCSFNEKELTYIRETTKKCGLPVMVHVNFPDAIRSVADVAMDSVEHGYFITEDILKRMAKNHVSWTPTLAPFANVLTYGTSIQGWNTEIVRAVVEQQKAMIKKAAAFGVPILLGSDSGSSIVPHGRGTQDEYDLLTTLVGVHFS